MVLEEKQETGVKTNKKRSLQQIRVSTKISISQPRCLHIVVSINNLQEQDKKEIEKSTKHTQKKHRKTHLLIANMSFYDFFDIIAEAIS